MSYALSAIQMSELIVCDTAIVHTTGIPSLSVEKNIMTRIE